MATSRAPALVMAQELRAVPTPPTFCDDLEEAIRKQAEKKQKDEMKKLSIFEAEECLDSSVKMDLVGEKGWRGACNLHRPLLQCCTC